MKIRISLHAQQRGRERLGLSVRQLKESAISSLENGIDAMSDESLRPGLIKSALKHNASGIYLFQNGVFIFKEDTLVTVYPISWLNLF